VTSKLTYFKKFLDLVRKADQGTNNLPKVFKDTDIVLINNLEEAESCLKQSKFNVLIIDMIYFSIDSLDILYGWKKAIERIVFLRSVRQGNFEPLNNKYMPVIFIALDFDLLDVSDKINTCRDFLDPERDILLQMADVVEEKKFIEAVKTAMERASLPPGEVRIL
jgi:hypothetical protein